MSRRLSFSREARQELVEAARHYDRESPGLGPRFLDAIEEATRHLLTYPKSATAVRGTFRSWPLREFPYSIIFSLPASAPPACRARWPSGWRQGRKTAFGMRNVEC